MKYRKKPVIIDAVRFILNGDEIVEWSDYQVVMVEKNLLIIETLEGDMFVRPGDWVIRGVENEYYPCKNSIFRDTYEEAE